MSLNSDFSAPPSAPEWLVCNGSVTVGPVRTDLLLRGVLHGRVPSSSWVRQTGWQAWRELYKIREVSALRRVLERGVDDQLGSSTLREGAEALPQASDAGEALLIALHAAANATSATVGLAHRVREPLRLPTTSCVFEASSERLGEVLPWFDPTFALARTGAVCLLRGSGKPGSAEHASARRLSPDSPLSGVALLPIRVANEVHAVLELGRSDHPFRSSDSSELSEFAQRVAQTLARLAANPKGPPNRATARCEGNAPGR
jgi:hypothetical protein